MVNRIFSNIPIRTRGEKPRESGLTVIIDEKLGLRAQEDFLNLAGIYVDLAKIATGISSLIDAETLKAKIKLYDTYKVACFPGGQFLEYVTAKDQVRDYFSDLLSAGFKNVEVSDNLIDITQETKCDLIRIACQEYGLRVIGETGSKKVFSNLKRLVDDVRACLNAGAWKVMFEAAELFDNGRFKEETATALLQEVDVKSLIFELPGNWIPGITISHIFSLQIWLIDHFGLNVNIGNVDDTQVLSLEAERLNLGACMKFEN
jgi:phosphosulfolactate synthase